ncbi:MAG TPA: hypothetical protein VM869_30070 [Enhygromyxa sp.]|nr:hypothetical protein [Enhygromyxa sp.]
MNNTTRLLPTLALGLLLTTSLACDDGEPDDQPTAELEAAATPDRFAELELQLEQEQGLELEFVAEIDDGTTILWTAVDEIAPDPAAGVCGGKWEYKSTVYECGECDVLGDDGKKYEHYKRWCWTGPGCASCEEWQYTGWSCFEFHCDGSIAPSDGPTDVLALGNDPAPGMAPSDIDGYGFTEAPAEFSDIHQVAPPPEKGVCGGYWELKATVDWQGCGTCMHTAPNPDREGNLGLWKERWCWTGAGCSGCEPWIVTSTQCYDNCE